MATQSIFQWHYFALQLLPVQAQAIHYNRNNHSDSASNIYFPTMHPYSF